VTSPFLVPGRDPRAKFGRPKRDDGQLYYSVPGANFVSTAAAALAANVVYYHAWYTPSPIVIDQMAAEVTTLAGTNFRIGFYAADTDWQPLGAPLADSGNLSSASAGVKTYTPGTPIRVTEGRYVSAITCDGAPSLRGFRSSWLQPLDSGLGASPFMAYMQVTRAYAAFPTPAVLWTSVSWGTTPFLHYVAYRVTVP
jgi:hypothetical protein